MWSGGFFLFHFFFLPSLTHAPRWRLWLSLHMGKGKKRRVSTGLCPTAGEMRQEKLSVYWGLHLRRGISSPTPHHWGHQSLQQHTWHLDGLWNYFLGFIRWCLLHDLISQRLPMLHKRLFYIPRNTCSRPSPALTPPSPPFGLVQGSFRCG